MKPAFIQYCEEGGELYPGENSYQVGIRPGGGIAVYDFRNLDEDGQEMFAQLWRDGKLNFGQQMGVKNPGFHVLPFFLRIGPLVGKI